MKRLKELVEMGFNPHVNDVNSPDVTSSRAHDMAKVKRALVYWYNANYSEKLMHPEAVIKAEKQLANLVRRLGWVK